MLIEKIINENVKYVVKPFRISQNSFIFVVAEDIDVDELMTHANYKSKLAGLPIISDDRELVELILTSKYRPSEKARFITALGYKKNTSKKMIIDFKITGAYNGRV